MMSNNHKINEDLCHNVANAFLDIGSYSNELDKQIKTTRIQFACDSFYSIPAIVNIAFACELYLKALLTRESEKAGKLKYEDDLLLLYKDLPSCLCDNLAYRFEEKCKYPVTLEQTFEIHAKAFQTWRYIYEADKSKSIAYPENLLLAAEVLRDELEQSLRESEQGN